MKKSSSYRGRFAPSPTGELHFGSLIAALGSYLQAKSQQGQWLIRIEDIDETRTVPQSDSHILSTLDNFGFEWDQTVIYQSQRKELYQHYLQQLTAKQLVYACDCSRAKLKKKLINSPRSGVYPGICRNKKLKPGKETALRCLAQTQKIEFNDQVQGTYSVDLAEDCGDFIIKRRDGFFAYQLVVAIDDAEQGITDIVRGADLLSATPQQIYLQQQLDLPHPSYAHLPVAMHSNGQKLSKSHQDLPIHEHSAVEILCTALEFLNQSPIDELYSSSLDDFWIWAIENWNLQRVPQTQSILV